jgi:hypothetical protein
MEGGAVAGGTPSFYVSVVIPTISGGIVGGGSPSFYRSDVMPTVVGGAVGGGTSTVELKDNFGKLSSSLFRIILDASADSRYAWLSGTLFKITLEASVDEHRGSLNVTLPSITLVAKVDGSSLILTGQVDASLPTITLTAHIAQSLTLPVSDEEVENLALCLNIETGTLTEFSNYKFASYACIRGTYVGANSSGLFELSGDDDNGTLIKAKFRLARNNFGLPLFKRLWNSYVSHKNEEEFDLRTIDNAGLEFDGVTQAKSGEDFKTQQVKLNRRYKSNYWGIEYENEDGSDFEVDSIEITAELLNRRA